MVERDRTYSSATYGWRDYVGSFTDFNLHGIDVTFSNGNLTFDMYTNFNDDGTYDDGTVFVYLADFAFDIDRNGSYEYGVVLLDHDQWAQGIAPTLTDLNPGLYSVTDWDTSHYFLENSAPNYLYGGRWDEGNPKDANVAIAGYTGDRKDATINFSSLGGSGAVGDPEYKWSFTINAEDIGFSGGSMDIFWGGATCANDAIDGTLTIEDENPATPEPATLFLTGFGLIGMVAIGIRKNRKRGL
jgi:hypothetical protein